MGRFNGGRAIVALKSGLLLGLLGLMLSPAVAQAGGKKGAKKAPKCSEADRVYFQQLPPAPVWPAFEAMQIELTEGKRGTCNLRMVVTGKESYELLAYRAVCRKVHSSYRCSGVGGGGSLWFDVMGRGSRRRMTLRLPSPGLILTGLANRRLRDHIRTPRGTITVDLVISHDGQSDHRS